LARSLTPTNNPSIKPTIMNTFNPSTYGIIMLFCF
jgi:hypothetical protein